MKRFSFLASRIFLVLILLSFVTLNGCRKPRAKIVAGEATASFESPNLLMTSLALANEGSATAENVEITSLKLNGATLTLPASLPVNIGQMKPDGDASINANFTSPAAKADAQYRVSIAGTFVEAGHTFKFEVQEDFRTPVASPGSGESQTGSAPTRQVTGAPFPAQKPNFGNEVNEGEHVRRVPTGPVRPLTPSNESTVQPPPSGPGGSASVSFPTNKPVGISSSTTAEPSGASGGGVVFETANWYAAYSTDNGTTFHQLDPTTVFPNGTAGGYCCDQIVQYAPTIDRFIWVLQYGQTHLSTDGPSASTGPNLYRIAFASPAAVKSSSGTSWTYFDITSTALLGSTAGAWLDYPDASIGDNYFYLSTDSVSVGRVVVRVPLSDIKNGGTINFRFTSASNGGVAYGGHLTQNTRDEVFWAGHNNSSSIRIFNWPESSTSYNWRDISIGSWPNTTSTNLMTSKTPDNQDWLNKLSGFPGNAVTGLARSNGTGDNSRINRIYFAWTGAIGSGFKQPQVQWIAVDRNNNFALVSQQQVWNSGYAFAYPAFAVNSANEIGMSLEWGGGGNYENHVAGFWGDYVVYKTTNSSIGTTRFGDYVTIRQHTADTSKFDAFGYGLNKNSSGGTTVDTHYLVFGR